GRGGTWGGAGGRGPRPGCTPRRDPRAAATLLSRTPGRGGERSRAFRRPCAVYGGARARVTAPRNSLYWPPPSMKPLLYSVLPRPAHPTRDGLAIRNFHLLEAIAREFRVRAFTLAAEESRGTGESPAGVEVVEIDWSGSRIARAAAAARSVVSGEALPILLYRSGKMAARLAAAVSRERPEWIVAHSYHVAEAAFAGGAPAWGGVDTVAS